MKITIVLAILLLPLISHAQWGKRFKKNIPVNTAVYEKPDFLTTPNGADDDELQCDCYSMTRGAGNLDYLDKPDSKIISCKTWYKKGKKLIPRADYTNLNGGNWFVVEYHESGRIHRTGIRRQNGAYMAHSDTTQTPVTSNAKYKYNVFEYYQTCRSGTWMEYEDKDGAEAEKKNYKCP